jgi:hypothetical protein
MTLRTATALAPGSTVEAEVGVVGGGPAGLAVALALAEAGVAVALLEAGGLGVADGGEERDTLELAHAGVATFRREQRFGGTSWYGRCVTLDAIDFEARAGGSGSEWPFARREIESRYAAAARWLGLARPQALAADFWREEAAFELLDGGGLAPRVHLLSPAKDLGRFHRRRVAGSPRLDAILGATLVGIDLAPAGQRVERIRFAGADGGERAVVARQWVLACGGLENARQLLLLEEERPGSLGVSAAQVGRGFFDHPRCEGLARLRLDPAAPGYRAIYRRLVEGPSRRARCRMQLAVGIDEARQRDGRLLDPCGFFYPASEPCLAELGQAAAALRSGLLRAGEAGANLRRGVRLLAALPLVVAAGAARVRQRPFRLDHLVLVEQLEQPLDERNRLTLAATRDRFGRRKLRVAWSVGEETVRSHRRFHQLLAARVEASGAGRLESRLLDDPECAPAYGDGAHPMGATRLSAEPARGVADADGRVHALDNLFLAGSSLFPRCGHANPTLTLVALALRLADHLKSRTGAVG